MTKRVTYPAETIQQFHNERRKLAKKLMGNGDRKLTDQYESDGDPLPTKGEPVKRYLMIQRESGGGHYDYFYAFLDEPWEAGIYDITDDSDYYVEEIVDLDSGERLNVEVARGFYVQRSSTYEFPQPEAGKVRVFYYRDVDPKQINHLHRPGATDSRGFTRLHGVQKNIADDN